MRLRPQVASRPGLRCRDATNATGSEGPEAGPCHQVVAESDGLEASTEASVFLRSQSGRNLTTADHISQLATLDAAPQADSHRYLKPWVLLATVWLFVAGVLGFHLVLQREKAAEAESDRLAAQARVVEENLTRQLVGASAALAGVRYDIESGDRDVSHDFAPLRLKTLSDAMPGIRAMLVFNASGIVVDADRTELVGRNFSDSETFRSAAAGGDPSVLYVSPPFKSPIGGVTVSLGKAVKDSHGEFGGIVLATVDPEYFHTLMASIFYAPDMAGGIFHGDGKVVYLLPEKAGLLSQNMDVPGSMFRRHRESGEMVNVFEGTSLRSGEDRMVAMRTMQPPALLMSRPLVIGVSRLRSEIYAPWRAEVATTLILAAVACATSVVLLYMGQRRRKALAAIRASVRAVTLESAQRLELAMKCGSIGLMDWDVPTGALVLNSLARKILGLDKQVEMTVATWRALQHPDDAADATSAVRSLMQGEQADYSMELRVRHALGHYVWLHVRAEVVERDARQQPLRVMFTYRDVSEHVEAQQKLKIANAQLAELSLTDALTGIGNRRRFDQELASAWARAMRNGAPVALLMIDIDYFKLYNDHYGHQAGDHCLREVAHILSEAVRRPDELLARYGGEEFAVLMAGSDLPSAMKLAVRCIEQVRAAALPHASSKVARHVTLSIGVHSMVPPLNTPADQLVKAADEALYYAKANGRDRACGVAPDAQGMAAPKPP